MTPLLPKISVLFVTFNRMVTLKPTLETFLSGTDYPRDRLELIACDDCSAPEAQGELKLMPFDRICIAPRRQGLGANVNQGLRVATGDFILQLQDDWECFGRRDYLRLALAGFDAVPEAGMLILNQHPNPLPVRRRIPVEDLVLRVYENRPDRPIMLVGEHAYTDWPHLKRASFHANLGLYREGVPMWEAELDFSRRVNDQLGAFVGDFEMLDCFRHIGADHSFNWTWQKRVERALAGVPGGTRALQLVRSAKARFKR